jgi:hypothetical protein
MFSGEPPKHMLEGKRRCGQEAENEGSDEHNDGSNPVKVG